MSSITCRNATILVQRYGRHEPATLCLSFSGMDVASWLHTRDGPQDAVHPPGLPIPGSRRGNRPWPGAGPQHLHTIGYITPRIRNTIDRNPAGALILRHRRFGTFEPEAGRCTYGLTKNIENLCSFGNPGWKRSPAQARPRQREAGA